MQQADVGRSQIGWNKAVDRHDGTYVMCQTRGEELGFITDATESLRYLCPRFSKPTFSLVMAHRAHGNASEERGG